jgi:outer membrane protein assembly factor BamB
MSHSSQSAAPIWTAFLTLMLVFSASYCAAQSPAWPTHSHDEQHTGVSSVQSQPLSKLRWKTPVDLAVPTGEIFIHYGSPLVTARNTVIVPLKIGTDSFRVVAHNGATGNILWKHSTSYQAPFANFLPGMGPTLFQNRLFIPDSAGRVMVRRSPDLATGKFNELYFLRTK